MDQDRFDRWTRRLSSRRDVVATILGAGAALPFAAAGAATSQPNGKGTRRNKKHNAKSGHGKGGNAFGCTKHDNACAGVEAPCPNFSGGFCILIGKKSVCASAGVCHDCKSDADCRTFANDQTARCVKKCADCQAQGAPSACIVPATGTPSSTRSATRSRGFRLGG
jgi:hypothetical protein